ncbi:MAG: hypothetical protein EB127_19015 [Alphaproteobacteria bacterium]|nr:hypothetical protein [Alphaproteobacteria bacterium]
MAKPITREDFKEYCLRKLGKPVIEINVDDTQVEDRIDEALSYYHDYHFDGTEKVFLAHQITQQDIDNKYLSIPEAVIGVINIFDVGDSYSTNNLFNIRYQIALNDLFAFNYGPFAPYYMALQNVALAEELFVGRQALRYNRHINKLYIDMAWGEKVQVDEYIIIEAYQKVDPDTYSDVWSDRWLQKYATSLIKKQWGENLKKFEGLQMPGGLTFNGQKIWDEAVDELTALEAEMISSYSLPVSDMIG